MIIHCTCGKMHYGRKAAKTMKKCGGRAFAATASKAPVRMNFRRAALPVTVEGPGQPFSPEQGGAPIVRGLRGFVCAEPSLRAEGIGGTCNA